MIKASLLIISLAAIPATLAMEQSNANEPYRLLAFMTDAGIGACSGGAAMVGYTPFHYFQNRTIQKLPIVWKNPTYWFRGLPSLALGKAPSIGLQLATYSALTELMEENPHDLSNRQKLLAATMAGGASGIFSNLTHLIALHQENQGSSFKGTTKQLSLKKCFVRGLGTTVMREMLFVNVYMNLLQPLKAQIAQHTNNVSGAYFLSGLASGAVIAATTQPLMVLNAHLYADMEKKSYVNGVDAFIKIIRERGVKGLYAGSGYRSLGIMFALPILDYVEKTMRAKLKN